MADQPDEMPDETPDESATDARVGIDDEAAQDEVAQDEPVVVTAEVVPDTDEVAEAEPETPETLHGVPVNHSRGQVVLHPTVDQYADLVRTLRQEGYWACIDLLGVDYLGVGGPRGLPAGTTAERFEVVVVLRNPDDRRRIRIRVQVPEVDPIVPSITSLHPGMENPEREAFDMFGIRFDGHPDPSRILMPDEWQGHPLRKDYDVGAIPVQFKAPSSAR